MQTESEIEVRSLLDNLGLREKQQFVRVSTCAYFMCRRIARAFSFFMLFFISLIANVLKFELRIR